MMPLKQIKLESELPEADGHLVAGQRQFLLKNGPTPASFIIYFWSFQTNIITIFTTNICEKNIDKVYGAGILTHNLWHVSLLP